MTSHVLKSVNLGIGGSQNVNLYLKNYSEACRINKLQYSLLKQWKLAFHQIFSPPLQFLERACADSLMKMNCEVMKMRICSEFFKSVPRVKQRPHHCKLNNECSDLNRCAAPINQKVFL